jgi:hypothetical protein
MGWREDVPLSIELEYSIINHETLRAFCRKHSRYQSPMTPSLRVTEFETNPNDCSTINKG